MCLHRFVHLRIEVGLPYCGSKLRRLNEGIKKLFTLRYKSTMNSSAFYFLRKISLCLVFASIGVSVGTAQSQINKAKDQKSERDDRQQTRLFNVIQVKKFAQYALGFQDLRIKVTTVARLADLIWNDDEDFARQLFSKALDACLVAESEPSNTDEQRNKRLVASLRRQIIGSISHRDANWAKRLIDSDLFSEAVGYTASQVNIEIAYDLARNDDVTNAVGFAERSLTNGVSPWIVGLLMELRRTDPKQSDSLFLNILNKLASQPADLNTFLYLGTYLFTSPRLPADDPTAFSQVVVGNVLVYDLTLDRPNISLPLVRAYLQTAVGLLSRPTSDSAALYYATGYLLLPKAQRVAPELAPGIMTAMRALEAKVPREMVDGSAYKNLSPNSSVPTEETLSAIEKLPSEGQRDEKYLSVIASLWQRKQYATARSIAKKFSDPNVSARIMLVIDFGEAADSLSKNDIPTTQRFAETMSPGIERGLLWLAIAEAWYQTKDQSQSATAVAAAVDSVKSLADVRRANVLLEAAGLMAKLNTGSSMTALTEAIKELNGQKPGSLRKIEWRQSIEIGRVTRVFSLKIKGVETDYLRALSRLASLDLLSLIAALDTVKQEEARSQLMLALAAALIAESHV